MREKRSDDALIHTKGLRPNGMRDENISVKAGIIPAGWQAGASSVFRSFHFLLTDVAVAVDIEDAENLMVVPFWGIKVINEGLS